MIFISEITNQRLIDDINEVIAKNLVKGLFRN
jgi:hypothetical protein